MHNKEYIDEIMHLSMSRHYKPENLAHIIAKPLKYYDVKTNLRNMYEFLKNNESEEDLEKYIETYYKNLILLDEKKDIVEQELVRKDDFKAIERLLFIEKFSYIENGLDILINYLNSEDYNRNGVFELLNKYFDPDDEDLIFDDEDDEDDVEQANIEYEEERKKRAEYYKKWNKKCFKEKDEIYNYLKSLDIFNKKIKGIKFLGIDEHIDKQHFIDLYHNHYMKNFKDFRKKVKISDFPLDAEYAKSVGTYDPFKIIFDDDSSLDIWYEDYGVCFLSYNQLNYESRIKCNFDSDKMFKEIIGKKIKDIDVEVLSKDTQMFNWFVKDKSVDKPIDYIIFKLDDGQDFQVSHYTMFYGTREEGAVRVPFKEYLECIYDYEKYFEFEEK